jgi:hypothetical protein
MSHERLPAREVRAGACWARGLSIRAQSLDLGGRVWGARSVGEARALGSVWGRPGGSVETVVIDVMNNIYYLIMFDSPVCHDISQLFL